MFVKNSVKSESSKNLQPVYFSWLVCFTASLFFFYELVQFTVFNTISNDLIKTFALSTLQLSRLSASYLYACALFLLPAGWLFDRFSTKKLLVIIACLCVLGTGLLAGSSSISVATIGRVLTGIGNAFAFLGCMRLASRWFPAHKLALVMGLIVTIAMLGGIVAQTPFALLVSKVGWRQAMFINALVGIVIILLMLFIVRDEPSSQITSANQSLQINFLRSLRLAAKNKQNWLCGLYTGLLNLPIMMLGALWGNLYLMQGHGFSATTAGNITSLIFCGLILGAPLIGWISDKLHSRRTPMIASAFLILLTMIIIVYIPLPFAVFSSLFFIMGILSGAQVLSYPLVAANTPAYFQSTCLGLVAVIVNMIGAISQMLFGWLVNLKWNGLVSNSVPIHSLSEYQFALIIMPLAFFISLIMAILIRDTYSISET